MKKNRHIVICGAFKSKEREEELKGALTEYERESTALVCVHNLGRKNIHVHLMCTHTKKPEGGVTEGYLPARQRHGSCFSK